MNHVPVWTRSPHRLHVTRSDDRGHAERIVIHQRDRFFVAAHLPKAGHRAENLIAPHWHAVMDCEQQLWRNVGAPGTSAGNSRESMRSCAPAATLAPLCRRISSVTAVRTTGPPIVCGSRGSPSTYCRAHATVLDRHAELLTSATDRADDVRSHSYRSGMVPRRIQEIRRSRPDDAGSDR